MPVEVILPKVDMDMESGLISIWHVSEGDHVTKGQPLFDIETDKAAMEVESPSDGVIHHISAAAGDTVPIGRAVAWLFTEGEKVGDPPEQTTTAILEPLTAVEIETVNLPPEEESTLRATPAARRLAQETQSDLTKISGTGPRGRIQRDDVEAHTQGHAPTIVTASPTDASMPLSVQRSGLSEGTPWVMIHGFGADAGSWSLIEKDLADTGPVIRIELPGHGKSPPLSFQKFTDLVARMRDCFDDLQLEPAHLVGHSLGGAVALGLADTRPRLISKLTLIAPAGLGPDINPAILDGLLRATNADSLAPWLQMMVHNPKLITANYASAAANTRAKLLGAQRAMAQALFNDGTQCFDVSAALERLDCPTRIIWGKQDQVIPWTHALKAPGTVSLNLLDQTGHLPHFEQAELVSRLLRL